MKEDTMLYSYLRCNKCSSRIDVSSEVICSGCGKSWPLDQGAVLKFVDGDTHSNFGLQWRLFSKTQLDSFNGSNESAARLLTQSKLQREDFSGRVVLEIGCGNGRFTEILLSYGAKVIAVDYSDAVHANLENNRKYYDRCDLLLIQGDLFSLPLAKHSFDLVVVYGVLQHTGDNERALTIASSYVANGGTLLVDIYAISIRRYNPWIYFIRFIVRLGKFKDETVLRAVRLFIRLVFNYQVFALRKLHGKKGLWRFLRYIVNRSPNSVYGINLWLGGKISKNIAREWCVLDTFDAWAPKFDNPVTSRTWRSMVNRLENDGFRTDFIGESGQGHVARLQRVIPKS